MYRKKTVIAAVLYISFCICVVSVALISQPYYPVRTIAGESSVGTWLSGMMLITVATISMVLCIQKGIWPWGMIALFFVYLALDERFMYHECLKEWLLLTLRDKSSTVQLIGEMPVMIGSIVGFVIALILYKNFTSVSAKVLLGSAVLCGISSVVIDIEHYGVFWEDLLKLIGELCLVCAFIGLIPLNTEEKKKVLEMR